MKASPCKPRFSDVQLKLENESITNGNNRPCLDQMRVPKNKVSCFAITRPSRTHNEWGLNSWLPGSKLLHPLESMGCSHMVCAKWHSTPKSEWRTIKWAETIGGAVSTSLTCCSNAETISVDCSLQHRRSYCMIHSTNLIFPILDTSLYSSRIPEVGVAWCKVLMVSCCL